MSVAHQYRGIDLPRMEEIEESGNLAWQVYLAAREYVAAGIYVVPLRPGEKAMPRKETHINYGSASRSAQTIEKWFHPEHGRFPGHNIGIATGRTGGVFAVDIDRHGDVDGFETLQALEEEHGELPEGPTQVTPGGGEHRLFLWQDNAASSTDKIGPGIDTRGGEEMQCKGHIVVFPSEVGGKKYRWSVGGSLPLIPRWLMERMGVAWRHIKMSTGRGLEEADPNSTESHVPIEQVREMLATIDPDELSYDEWLRLGMAVKSQYPGEDGLHEWDLWSQKGERYQPEECRIRWNGFDEGGTVRMATLFFFAKESGWEPKKEDVKPGKLEMVVERMNDRYAVVPIGGKVRILREHDVVADPVMGHYDLLDKESLRTLHQNDVIMTEGEKPKPITAADLWLAAEHRRTYPMGMKLCPPGVQAPPGIYNTWAGFSATPRSGDPSMFIDMVHEVICSGDEALSKWIMDWCADLVQDPGNPKGTAIVMRGQEGAGKGTLANTIGELFGPHFLHLIDDSHLTNNFNAHMIDTIFTFADEITWGGNKKTAGKLKGIVTEKFLLAERKGVDAVGYRNMNHLMIASNNDWVIPAGTNSRRWLVVDVSSHRIGDHGYWGDLQDWLGNGGREALLHHLLNREVTSDLRRAPHTASLQDQRDRTDDNSIRMWWGRMCGKGQIDVLCLDQDKVNVWPTTVIKEELYEAYEKWCMDRKIRPEHPSVFAKEMLHDKGVSSARASFKGKRYRVFYLPPVPEGEADE